MSTFEGPTVPTPSLHPELHDGNYNPHAPVQGHELPGWMDDARCLDADLTIFFPEQGGSPEPAKRLCNDCPVRTDCLDYALEIPTNADYGIWGGTTERERRRLRALRRHRPDHRREAS